MADKPNVSIPLTKYERAMVHNFLGQMKPQTGARLSAEAEDRIYDIMLALDATSLDAPNLRDAETSPIELAYRDAEWLRDRYQEGTAHDGGLAMGLVPAIRKLRKAITEAEERAKATASTVPAAT